MPDGSLPARDVRPVFVPDRLRPPAGFSGTALPAAPARAATGRLRCRALRSCPRRPPRPEARARRQRRPWPVCRALRWRISGASVPQTARPVVPDAAPPWPRRLPWPPRPEALRTALRVPPATRKGWPRVWRRQADLARAREDLRHALGALDSALARPSGGAVDALASQLEATVTRLAAQRAGQAIDAAPVPFARRIARLAARVAQHQAMLRMHLHPDDLAVIAPLVAAGLPDLADLAAARLVPDAALMRGDADLRAPGVRLADLWDGGEDPA